MSSINYVPFQTIIPSHWLNDIDQGIYEGVALWGVASGADLLVVTLSPVPEDYFNGMLIGVRVAAANTTTTPTINCNGLGLKNIKREGNRALLVGDFPRAGYEALLRFSTTTDCFELLNPGHEEFIPSGTDAVPSSVQDELDRHIVSSLRFMTEVQRNDVLGRVGSTDVASPIQKWADYCMTKACTGDGIPGIYKLGATITVAGENAVFRGRGYNTIFRRDTDYGSTFVFTGNDATGDYLSFCGLEDVQIQALGPMNSGAHVLLNGVDWFSLKNIRCFEGFIDFDFAGVESSTFYNLYSRRATLNGGVLTGRKGIKFRAASQNYAHPSCADLFVYGLNVKGNHGAAVPAPIEDSIYITSADGIWLIGGHTSGGNDSGVTFSAEDANNFIGSVMMVSIHHDPTRGAGIRFKGNTNQIFEVDIVQSNVHGASGLYGETAGILVEAGCDLKDSTFTEVDCYTWGEEGVKLLSGTSLTFNALTCKANSNAVSNVKSGIYMENTQDVRFIGGSSGFDRPFTGARTQKYGIEFGSGNYDCVLDGGLDLQGNISGSIGGGAGQYRTGDVLLDRSTSAAVISNLVNVGGKKFNGTTDYLDGSALTGTVDSLKGTFIWKGRFANVSGTQELIFQSTGAALQISRESNSAIKILAENAGGTIILNQNSTGFAAAPDAAMYIILASWDLAVPGSMRLYVNDVQNTVSGTFDGGSGNIFYTAAEYAIGANTVGAIKFTGDMYVIGFLDGTYIDFNVAANHRKFFDRAGNCVLTGNGSAAFGAVPRLLLYGRDYPEWPFNLGNGTGAFTVNGTPAAPTVMDYGYEETVQREFTVTAAAHTVGSTTNSIIGDRAAGTITLTLDVSVETVPRELLIRTVQNQAIVSAAANVVPLTGGAAGTSLCAATAGKWVRIRKAIGAVTYQAVEGN